MARNGDSGPGGTHMKTKRRVGLSPLISVFFLTLVAIPATGDPITTPGPIVWTGPFNLTNDPSLPNDTITGNLTINVLTGQVIDSTAQINGTTNSVLQVTTEAAGNGGLTLGLTDVFED